MSTTTITSVSHHKAISFSSPISTTAPPTRKTMSVTQTYFLAHKARAKLSSEAARADHNLRLLVGHANLLDTLMLELAEAEREQESWFNQSMRASQQQQQKAQPRAQQESSHIQWSTQPAIAEESEEDWDASEADDDDDVSDTSSDAYDEDDEDDDSESSLGEGDEDLMMTDVDSGQQDLTVVCAEVDDTSSEEEDVIEAVEGEGEGEDDDEDFAALSLTRSSSHYHHLSASAGVSPIISALYSPPELLVSALDDSDLSSDDEADMPPSPPTITLKAFSVKPTTAALPPVVSKTAHTITNTPTSQKQHQHVAFDDDHRTETSFYVPPRNPSRPLSVY